MRILWSRSSKRKKSTHSIVLRSWVKSTSKNSGSKWAHARQYCGCCTVCSICSCRLVLCTARVKMLGCLTHHSLCMKACSTLSRVALVYFFPFAFYLCKILIPYCAANQGSGPQGGGMPHIQSATTPKPSSAFPTFFFPFSAASNKSSQRLHYVKCR